MPFGLTNAPSTFQGIMNEIFRPYLGKFVLLFFCFFMTFCHLVRVGWVEHLEHLEMVLKVLLQNQLYAKKSKCSFNKEQLEYLGHLISMQMVETDPTKIECMTQ